MIAMALIMLGSPFGKFILCCLVTTMLVDWKQERDGSI